MSKKKIIATIIALLASAGILVGSLSSDYDDINKKIIKAENSKAVINTYKEKNIILVKIFNILKKIIGIPLWLIASLLIKIIFKIIKLITLPIIKYILFVLIITLLLIIICMICIKILCPNLKIRQIIDFKMFISSFISALIILLFYIFKENIYAEYEYLIIFSVGIIDITFNICPYLFLKTNNYQKQIEEI